SRRHSRAADKDCATARTDALACYCGKRESLGQSYSEDQAAGRADMPGTRSAISNGAKRGEDIHQSDGWTGGTAAATVRTEAARRRAASRRAATAAATAAAV